MAGAVIRAVVSRHPRLQFKDAAGPVEAFVARRLAAGGVSEVCFADDAARARAAAAAMCAQSPRGYIALLDVMSPLTDHELLRAMVDTLQRNEADACVSDGAVPGTQVELVIDAARVKRIPDALDGSGLRVVRTRWHTQERYNNQFNLYKYKRLKMFLKLLQRLDGMHELGVDEFVRALEREDIFRILAAFGEEDARLVWHEACPHCRGRLTPLPMRMSQPLCGYLPSSRALYHECERCTLVVASPVLHEDDVARVYDEFDKQDFVASLNNPYDGESPRCDFTAFEKDLPARTRMLDLGGGIGKFSQFVKSRHPAWSVTHADFAIKENKHLIEQGIETRAIDFLKEPIGRGAYDVVTAWEVIEHVPYSRLGPFLDNVHNALAPGGYFVFSTPNFDSPLCKSFDFYAGCPPFHYLVFNERWLREHFTKSGKWHYGEPRACSDFLDDAVGWFDYGAKTAPSMQLRSLSRVLEQIFRLDQSKDLRRQLLRQGSGTEVIVTLQKPR